MPAPLRLLLPLLTVAAAGARRAHGAAHGVGWAAYEADKRVTEPQRNAHGRRLLQADCPFNTTAALSELWRAAYSRWSPLGSLPLVERWMHRNRSATANAAGQHCTSHARLCRCPRALRAPQAHPSLSRRSSAAAPPCCSTPAARLTSGRPRPAASCFWARLAATTMSRCAFCNVQGGVGPAALWTSTALELCTHCTHSKQHRTCTHPMGRGYWAGGTLSY